MKQDSITPEKRCDFNAMNSTFEIVTSGNSHAKLVAGVKGAGGTGGRRALRRGAERSEDALACGGRAFRLRRRTGHHQPTSPTGAKAAEDHGRGLRCGAERSEALASQAAEAADSSKSGPAGGLLPTKSCCPTLR